MSIDAVAGLSGSDFASLNRGYPATQVSAVTPSAAAAAAAAAKGPAGASPVTQPLLLVPTQPPLTATVLAELIGRHLSATGLSPSE
jgi:hypothetical protein